jgi:hypothetical protein
MASSARLQCVFVADTTNDVIHIVDKVDITNSWPVNDIPSSLSVNAVDNVIVTCKQVKKIKELTTDGKLVRVVKLANELFNPRHTIQLTNDQFLVTHGEADDQRHRVSVVNLIRPVF